MNVVIGSAITMLDLWVYLILRIRRANQELAWLNEEVAELRARFERQCVAQRDAMSRPPIEWRAADSIVRLHKPRDPRLN